MGADAATTGAAAVAARRRDSTRFDSIRRLDPTMNTIIYSIDKTISMENDEFYACAACECLQQSLSVSLSSLRYCFFLCFVSNRIVFLILDFPFLCFPDPVRIFSVFLNC